MKRLVFAALFCLSLSACAQSTDPATPTAAKPVATVKEPSFAAGTPEARVRDALRALNPRIQVESIDKAPIPGFREVIAGGQVIWVSDDGKYLFQGDLMDVAARKNLSDVALSKVRGEVLKTLPLADRIVFSPTGTPKHKVVVLTDIECGYCRKFHSEIAEINRRGIEVEYLAFPRAGLGSADYRKMVSVWCADDRKGALSNAKAGKPVSKKRCDNPVEMQYQVGQRAGVTGTPAVFAADGSQLGGYLPPQQMLQVLDGNKAAEAAGGAR